MPITQEQREQRRTGIGSSDSPKIVGVDPWNTSTDVWIEKVLPVDDLKSNEAIDIGNDFEEGLLRWCARELAVEIDINFHAQSRETPILRANCDAKVKGKRIGFEAKTTSAGENYGTEGTDEIPDRVIVQAQHQMYCAELDEVYVPVLTAEFGRLVRKMFRVGRNEDLIGAIVARDLDFWETYVLPKRMPTGTAPSLDVVKRIRRAPESFAQVDAELVAKYRAASRAVKEAEAAKEEAQARLILAAGTSEGIDFGDPEKVYTYLEQSRVTVDGKRLKIHAPDLYSRFSNTSSFRTLREVNRF